MTNVSFTGTRDGASPAQIASIRAILTQQHATRLVHGDCLGADAEADEVAASLGIERHTYPCTVRSLRAHCETRGAIQMDVPRPPLVRNQTIVRAGEILLVVPKTDYEELRSGTWSTYRYAVRLKQHVIVVHRDGSTFESRG